MALILSACSSPSPVTSAEIKEYTGLTLCSSAKVRDLTTDQERETMPGYSFHVVLALDPRCTTSLQRQISVIAPYCTFAQFKNAGCFVDDADAIAKKHTSLAVIPAGPNTFDLSFWQ